MSGYQNYDGGYQTNNYSAGGNYNSGGFVAGSQSAQSPGGGDKKNTGNTLRPVTVKQIQSASQSHQDADFKIDDVEIGQLTVVGKVLNLVSAHTNTTYKLDDTTGTIEVKQWLDAETAANTTNPIVIDSYVRVTGQLKSFNAKRYLGASSIKLITDHNEVIYHMLESESVHLLYTRGSQQGAGGESNSFNNQNSNGAAQDSTLSGQLSGLDPFSRKIMEAIHSMPNTNEGIHTRQIQSAVGNTGGDLLQSIELLKEEGMLYTTIDEDHVKVLNSTDGPRRMLISQSTLLA